MERSSVRKEEYIVYGSYSCHYCAKAQTILEHYGKNYTYVDIMESPETQKAFFKKTNNASDTTPISKLQLASTTIFSVNQDLLFVFTVYVFRAKVSLLNCKTIRY